MGYPSWFATEAESPLGTLFPDFLLAAIFFTALTFAAMGQRFPRRSSAVASLAIGIALATGLVWWEADRGYSVRNLGPLAVGFAILLLAAVMYRVLREIGGQFAGVALSLGASLLIGWILGIRAPLNPDVFQTVTTVALVVGILALLFHQHHARAWFPQDLRSVPAARNDLRDLHRTRQLGRWLQDGLNHARRKAEFLRERGEAEFLHDRPEAEQDILVQLRRMLPFEGYLTERLAELRERAYRMRKGQVAQIEEIRSVISNLPPKEQQKLGEELVARYKELKLDVRLERLDRAGAEAERRIRELTKGAELALRGHDFQKVIKLLESASKLQGHNTRLFKIIDRTEKKLIALAHQTAQKTSEVTAP